MGGVLDEWWWWCARPGRLPRAAPLTILITTVLTLISLLFLLNARAGLSRHPQPRQVWDLEDHNFEGAPQHHPDLVSYIRQLHLVAPSSGPYNLKHPDVMDFSQNGQSKQIEKILRGKHGGTFVEAGAYTGEELSNTLYLERQLGWTGLLVEPDPWNFWTLRKRGRKSHALNACLSPSPFPKEVTFKQSDTMGHIVSGSEERKRKGIFTRVKCFPLYSLLLALNTTNLDLLSLDVEGAELQVLKTLPWNKVTIQVVCVEYKHVPEGGGVLTSYLRERGYALHSALGDDLIFVRKELMDDRSEEGIL